MAVNFSAMDHRTSAFLQHRGRLRGIAYRMLGSSMDADDLLQDAYLRWHNVDPERIRSPEAWLVTTVTRLCIDRLRSAQTERAAYTGPWLPEPISTDPTELASDLSVALLVVLERLAPEERAAFLLHDVFDMEHGEIASVLGRTEAACRQIVHRARERVHQDRPRFQVNERARKDLVDRFLAALRAQDHSTLLTLFAPDATWTADGGGKVKAARKVVHGSELVSRFALGIWRRYLIDKTARLMTVNGEYALVVYDGRKPFCVFTLETDGSYIRAVYAIVNPDKLQHIQSL
jgi:RNA polymerase sigma-70 factor (ECF subfamily)